MTPQCSRKNVLCEQDPKNILRLTRTTKKMFVCAQTFYFGALDTGEIKFAILGFTQKLFSVFFQCLI